MPLLQIQDRHSLRIVSIYMGPAKMPVEKNSRLAAIRAG
jgi:hypothetical protein